MSVKKLNQLEVLERVKLKVDFGSTLAHEKLTEIHDMKLSVESVRRLMIQEGLWNSAVWFGLWRYAK